MCIPSMHTTRAHVIPRRPKVVMERSLPSRQGMAATVTCSRATAVRTVAIVRSASVMSATRRGRPVCAVRVNAPSHAHFVCPGVRSCSMRCIVTQLQTQLTCRARRRRGQGERLRSRRRRVLRCFPGFWLVCWRTI